MSNYECVYLFCIVPILPNLIYQMEYSESQALINASINVSKDNATELRARNITEAEEKHERIVALSIPIGLLFASKPIVQVILTPFIGPLTNRFLCASSL